MTAAVAIVGGDSEFPVQGAVAATAGLASKAADG